MLLLFYFFLLESENNGIPLWFKCFKGTHNSEAFKTDLIISGIPYVNNLFKNKNGHLVFLADRWFPNTKIMEFIDSIGATYCIRATSILSIKIHDYEYSDSISYISDIETYLTKSKYFDNVSITKNNFKTKLAVSKSESHKEPFFILTNGSTREAIKHYGYRFGSIEFIFKNKKSNGFYLESTKMRNLHAFSTLFGIVCIATLWLTILGANYSKNKKNLKNRLYIRYSKKNGANFKRTLSLFNTGLFFFNLAFNSTNNVTIKYNFILYDT